MDAKLADKMRRRRAHQLESLRAARESAPSTSPGPTERVQRVLAWCSRGILIAAENGYTEVDLVIPVKKRPFRSMPIPEWKSLVGGLRENGYLVRFRRFLKWGVPCIRVQRRPRRLRNVKNIGGSVSADTIYRALTNKYDRQWNTAYLILVVSW